MTMVLVFRGLERGVEDVSSRGRCLQTREGWGGRRSIG